MIFQSRGPLRSFDKLKISPFARRPLGIKLGKVVTRRDSPEILFPLKLHDPLTTWSNNMIHNILKKLHILYHQTFMATKLGRVVTSDRKFIPQMTKSGVTSLYFSSVFLDGWEKIFFQCFIYCSCKHMWPVLNMTYYVFPSHMV